MASSKTPYPQPKKRTNVVETLMKGDVKQQLKLIKLYWEIEFSKWSPNLDPFPTLASFTTAFIYNHIYPLLHYICALKLMIVSPFFLLLLIATNQQVVAAQRQQQGLVAVTIRGSVLFYSSAI